MITFPKNLELHKLKAANAWCTAAKFDTKTRRGSTTQGEVGCGNWAPNTKKKIAKVWARLLSHLEICQNYYEKVRSTAANLDALERFWTKMQCEVSCSVPAPTTMKKIAKVWARLLSHLDICQNYYEKVRSTAANLGALEGFWTKMPCEVSCGIAAPTTMKHIDAVWRLFAMNLDIYQDYSEKVWYAAANLDALATLETTSSTKWTVAPKPKHDEVNCESKIPSRQAFQT